MQRAIAPFLTALTPPPQSFDKVVFAKTVPVAVKARDTSPTLKAPYSTETGDLVIEFDYSPAEPQTRNEPSCDEDVDIVSVWAGEIDILEWISDTTLEAFKERAILWMQEQREEADGDRAEARYLDRMEMSL
jgi:hypothetical protein